MKLRSKLFWIGCSGSLAVLALFVNSCTKEYIEEYKNVCFTGDVQPILVSNCTQSGCHNAQDKKAGLNLSNYDGILKAVKPGNYSGSKLYEAIVKPVGDEAMPPSPYNSLSDKQIAIIAAWIKEGAKNTTNCSTGTCDTTNVTLSKSVKPIFEKYCTSGCHSGSSPSAGIDLTQYDQIKITADDGSLVGSVIQDGNYSPMPKGGSKMPDCEIAKIKIWVAAGAKDN